MNAQSGQLGVKVEPTRVSVCHCLSLSVAPCLSVSLCLSRLDQLVLDLFDWICSIGSVRLDRVE